MPPEYPIHDKEGHLEFVLGMFFNTRQLVGLATEVEIRKLTPDWPAERRRELMAILERNGQLA